MTRGAKVIAASTAFGLFGATTALAQQLEGAQPRGIDLQPAATDVAAHIHAFHNFLVPLIVGISVFVLALLLWVIIRYNRRANPTPRQFTHNMLVEVIWTVVPVAILVVIAATSFPLLFEEERIPPSEYTLKVTGNSWRWEYEYPDLGVHITSNLLPQEQARAQNRPWLLATDEPLYVPVGATIRVLVTSNDVIHAWAVPAFGVKEDAIQGRVNETWFRANREGVFYGQCSELCGVDHAFMPIEVHVVSREEFNRWVTQQGGSLASAAPATGGTAAPAAAPANDNAAPAAPASTPAAAPQRSPAR